MNFRWFFLTGGYSGLFPKAPGTAGTLAALPAGVAILAYFGSQTLFLASLLLTLIALKAINAYEAQSGIHDDKRIVIDEVVGTWISLYALPQTMWLPALLVFRILDILENMRIRLFFA